jgi:hypothetical protein
VALSSKQISSKSGFIIGGSLLIIMVVGAVASHADSAPNVHPAQAQLEAQCENTTLDQEYQRQLQEQGHYSEMVSKAPDLASSLAPAMASLSASIGQLALQVQQEHLDCVARYGSN